MTDNQQAVLRDELSKQLPWAEEITFESSAKKEVPKWLRRVVVHTTVGEKIIRLRTQYYAPSSIAIAVSNGVMAGILEHNFDAWFWSPDREDVLPEDVE